MKRFLSLMLAALLLPSMVSATQFLQADVARQVPIGPFLDSDGVTPEESLTVTEWLCDIVKHAESSMAKTDLTITASSGDNDAAHLGEGVYSLELTAGNLDTEGTLFLMCTHATHTTFVPVFHEFTVLNADAYDAQFGTFVERCNAIVAPFGGWCDTGFAVDSTTVLDLTTGPTTTADTLNGEYTITIIDAGDSAGSACHRQVTDYATDQTITYDSACDFTVATADTAIVLPNGVGAELISLAGGGASLDTDANGRIRIVDGTGTGEIDTNSGAVVSVTTTATATSVTNGVTLANGAITNASLAGNMEIVFETDFATNYNTTRDGWTTNVEDTIGSGNLPSDPGTDTIDAAAIATAAIGSAEMDVDGSEFTEAGGDGDHLTEAGGDGDHLTEAGGTGDHLTAVDGLGATGETEIALRVLERQGCIIGTVDDANDAPSTTTAALDLTLPRAGTSVTAEDDAYIGYRFALTTSGSPPPVVDEAAWISDSAWANSELEITFDPALPAAMVDGDVVLICPF